MSEPQDDPSKPIAGWPALLIVLTIPALFLAVLSAGFGHGSYLFARLFFPIPMMLSPGIGPLAILLAVVQFPLYAVAISRAEKRGIPAPLALVVLVVVHLAAMTMCRL